MCFTIEVLESEEKLEILLKQEKNIRKRERLQFLYWYKTGQATTRKALGNCSIVVNLLWVNGLTSTEAKDSMVCSI